MTTSHLIHRLNTTVLLIATYTLTDLKKRQWPSHHSLNFTFLSSNLAIQALTALNQSDLLLFKLITRSSATRILNHSEVILLDKFFP